MFVRAPLLGAVKSRLAAGIGAAPARTFYAETTRALLHRVGTDRRWRTVLAVTPDRYSRAGRFWPGALPRVPQGSGDLGIRMAGAFRRYPAGPTVIVGSDVPGIERSHVAEAFAALGDADAVFGPAEDGGYWLIGLRHGQLARGLFTGVRWSTGHALADTLANLRGRRAVMLERLMDVDDAADLTRWRAAAAGRRRNARRSLANRGAAPPIPPAGAE